MVFAHGFGCDHRPDEAAAIQAFGVERHGKAVVPEDFDQASATVAKHEEIAGVRIALERLLNQQGQALHALAHVRVARRNPDPHPLGMAIIVGLVVWP